MVSRVAGRHVLHVAAAFSTSLVRIVNRAILQRTQWPSGTVYCYNEISVPSRHFTVKLLSTLHSGQLDGIIIYDQAALWQ